MPAAFFAAVAHANFGCCEMAARVQIQRAAFTLAPCVFSRLPAPVTRPEIPARTSNPENAPEYCVNSWQPAGILIAAVNYPAAFASSGRPVRLRYQVMV